MSDQAIGPKQQWVVRVLGVAVQAGGAGSGDGAAPKAFESAADAWMVANEAVDAQISSLQTALRGTKDVALGMIADAGLNGITGNFKVPVLAAIQDIRATPADQRAAAAARAQSAVGKFMDHLSSDPRVAACDGNPFAVAVSIRGTLLPALTGLAKSLETMKAG